jgi:hypothetical protein
MYWVARESLNTRIQLPSYLRYVHMIIPGPVGMRNLLLFYQFPLNGLVEGLSHMIIPGPTGSRDLLLFQQLSLNGLVEGMCHDHTWACTEEGFASVLTGFTQWS